MKTEQLPVEPNAVITSYSIHYTKLYDPQGGELRGSAGYAEQEQPGEQGQAAAAGDQQRLQGGAARLSLAVPETDQSYNFV